MTLKKCRKVLEEDMGLGPGGLDNHKDHVRDLIEKVVIIPSSCVSGHVPKKCFERFPG